MFCASMFCYFGRLWHISMGLVQVSHISIANALELRLSCTKPLISWTKELPTCYPGTSMLIRVITCCGINTKLMVKPLLNHQNGIPLHWYCNIIENIFLNVHMKQFLNNYRQISNISHTKSQNLNVSCLVLQLSLSNPLKPGVNYVNPGYFSLAATALKPQQMPMFLHISARVWGRRWSPHTSEQKGSM